MYLNKILNTQIQFLKLQIKFEKTIKKIHPLES